LVNHGHLTDGLACLADRCGSSDYKQWSNLDSSVNVTDPAMEEDYRTYRSLLLNTLQYAIDRLNQKAVYSNVIVFCAKIFGTLIRACLFAQLQCRL